MGKNDDRKSFNYERHDYLSFIRDENTQMIKNAFLTWVNSLVAFGVNSPVTKDVLKAIKEFIEIGKYEKSMLKFMSKHLSTLDIGSVEELIDFMNSTKELEIEYYETIFADVAMAASMKEDYRAKRIKKGHVSIKDNEEFKNNLLAAIFTTDDILKMYSDAPEFVDFIKKRIISNFDITDAEDDYTGVLYKLDDNGIVSDLKVILPTIIDYVTLLKAVNLLSKARLMYCNMRDTESVYDMNDDADISRVYEDASYYDDIFLKDFNDKKVRLLK